MSSANELQTLLRFLSQDAKIPLASAMGSVKALQSAEIASPTALAKADIKTLQEIFADDKLAKQVLNAAKRISKKRSAPSSDSTPPKKAKRAVGEVQTPAEIEESLALPTTDISEDELRDIVVYTNRAPLVLAFAFTLIRYTMPSQPLSSRLSLAQAVVSMNSRSKAVSIGLETGKSAEEDGWGEGQPVVRVMGRDIRVLKRWNYDLADSKPSEEDSTQASSQTVAEEEPALWGLDLEALRKSNTSQQPVQATARSSTIGQMPIYTAQSARSYLIKAFDSPPGIEDIKKKKLSAVAQREQNLACLLAAVDVLCKSWAATLDAKELDKRAWSWYMKVRPEVAGGVAGWGGKGNVKLADVLDMKRTE